MRGTSSGKGSRVAVADPNAARRLSPAFIPEERVGHGVVADMSLTENALLTCRAGDYIDCGFVQPNKLKSFAAGVIDRFRLRAAGIEAEARSLSGGNMQKLIGGLLQRGHYGAEKVSHLDALRGAIAACIGKPELGRIAMVMQPTWRCL